MRVVFATTTASENRVPIPRGVLLVVKRITKDVIQISSNSRKYAGINGIRILFGFSAG
jgi:hypothetical protein